MPQDGERTSKTQMNSDHQPVRNSEKPQPPDDISLQLVPDAASIMRRIQDATNMLTSAEILHLQHTLGNQAVQRLLKKDKGIQLDQETSLVSKPLNTAISIQRLPKVGPVQGQPIDFNIPATTTNAPPQRYFTYMDWHEESVKILKDIIEKGLVSPDRRLRNSCEWVKAGKTKLFALSETHDSNNRLIKNTKPKDGMAFFPKADRDEDNIYSGVRSNYDWQNLMNNDGIYFEEDKKTQGWNRPGKVVIYNVRDKPVDLIEQTLRHEVQHDADHNDDKISAFKNDKIEKAFESYKTEYRAFSYQGDQDINNESPIEKVSAYGYTWTKRQLFIFKRIWKMYPHTKLFWDETQPDDAQTPSSKGSPADSKAIKSKIEEIKNRQQRLVAYFDPDSEGFNKWNSVAVDNFYQALKAVPDKTNTRKDANFQILLKIKLNAEDAKYILESSDYKLMIKKKLKGKSLTSLNEKLQSCVSGK